MVTASKVICLKDITPTSCANFTISIFPKKFFGDNRMICFLLLMLFMPVNLIAQEQNNPAILVAKYQKKLINVLISLCSHNYKVELGQLRDKKKYDEREKLGMQETEVFFFLRTFVASANRYNLSDGVASGTYACPSPTMCLTLINAKGQKKRIKKPVRKMWNYLRDRVIAIARIKVETMEVFKVNQTEDISFDKFLAFSNRKERFESDVLGTLVLKDATICDLCVEQNESSFFPNHEIKEYGYSLLLSDVDVTIWTKD